MGMRVSMPIPRRGPWEQGLTHRERVMRCYRTSLRTARDWYTDWWQFEEQAMKIEAEFKNNKHVSVEEGSKLIQDCKQKLWDYRHHNPYVKSYMQGGTAWQRHTPPPIEWCDHGALPQPKYRKWH